MARAIIGVNVRLEVQSAVGAPKTVQDITADSSGVTTAAATAHGFSNGDIVRFTMTDGMDQLDGQAGRVANATTDDFELEDMDVTGFVAFVSGTVEKITAFATFAKAQTVSAPNTAPAKIPITTLLDVVDQEVFGIPGSVDGTVGALFNPGGSTEALIATATRTNAPLVFRITYADGRKTVFNSYVNGGFGFDLQQNQAAKSTVAFTPIKLMMHYPD